MNFEQTVDYIINLRHRSDIKGLARMRRFMELLGNPQDKLRYLHITGTNGKGSTTAMLNSILTCAGYKAGMFISPYVLEFRERIQIGGQMISKDDLVRIAAQIKPVIDQMYQEGDGPVQFEVVTAIGFVYFAEQKCDAVCLEVGIGGLRDSTNIIQEPLAAVFTNIGLDHTNMLGTTPGEIAAHKAGILKGRCPAIVYPRMDPDALAALMEKCAENGNPLIQGNFDHASVIQTGLDGTDFSYGGTAYHLPLLGRHQICNAITAIETIHAIQGTGIRAEEAHIVKGLAEVKFPARAEVLCRCPLTILDGAHNDNGAEALEGVLEDVLRDKRPIAVIMGMMADKDCRKVAGRIAKLADTVIAVTPSLEYRALKAGELAEIAGEFCEHVELGGGFRESFLRAGELAGENGAVVICGSLYLASDMRKTVLDWVKEKQRDSV